jgi:ATP-dependent RNA helicase DeaD
MNGEVETGSPELPTIPPPVSTLAADPKTFEEMGLLPDVKRALSEMGFLDPLPVQSAVFTRMMGGRDVLVQSRTGSGKTAAFGIPFAQGLIDPEQKKVQALVLAPTRELALQVAQECEKIGKYRDLHVVPIYGGAPMGKQVEGLKAGAQIVAGTPGRVLDHLRRGTLRLEGLKVLVLDEADEMLSMGFLEEITDIIKQCPVDRQTTLFSATIPEDIERIGSRYMRNAEKVALSTTADGIGAREIQHTYYMVSGMGRTRDLVRVLEVERPESAIIFCNTREETNLVAEFLKKNGLDAEAISSDLTQKDRERVMNRTKEKNLHYLVATDIAARGIDISDLSHVINFTFPESAEVYVHRTGRTGRAGKSGTAISLISPRELGNFYMLKLTYKIKPEERTLPTDEAWKTVAEAKKVDELREQVGTRNVSGEWRAVARRLWASEDGEGYVAALIQDRLAPERRRASDPFATSTAIPSTRREDEVIRDVAAAMAVPQAGVEAIEDSRAPSASGAARPGYEERRARRARNRRTGPRDEERGPSREGRGERGRGRGRDERGGRSASANARSTPTHVVKGTIDDSDGREFWEAWVDSKSEPVEGAPAPAPSAEATSAPAETNGEGARREGRRRRERSAPRELAPGQARLYLNLGRRDGLKEPEVRALLDEKQVTVDDLEVMNSHTYLFVAEERCDEVCAQLTGGLHGERQIVCERAKK